MTRRIAYIARAAVYCDWLLLTMAARAAWDRIDPTYPLSR